MPKTAKSAKDMISSMTPVLQKGEYVFCTTQDEHLYTKAKAHALSSFHETEGLSLICEYDVAKQLGFDVTMTMRCISLEVYSALDGVGLTAAVASALGQQNIPCNMVAAFHHDHVFIPSSQADLALETLQKLQQNVS